MFVAGIETAASNEVWIFRNGLFLVSLLLSLQAACNAVAFILHYFFLSAFCWMLCEGIMLYLMIVVVFSKMIKRWWLYLIFAWGQLTVDCVNYFVNYSNW